MATTTPPKKDTMTPPKETMQSLRSLFSPHLTIVPKSSITDLLDHHKAQLITHLTPPTPTPVPIRYRSSHPTTTAHPEPTPAENHYISTHNFPLPRHLIAIHLRDYLHATYPTNTHPLLHSTTLASYAPPHALINFATEEIKAAYHVLNTILTHSNPHFVSFRDANKPLLRDTLVKAVNTILSPQQTQPHSQISPDPQTVFSVLLTATSSNYLTVDDILPILTTYTKPASLPSRNALRSLENDPVSIHLLTAAVTTAIRHSAHLNILNSFRPLLTHDSTLPSLVSLSLAPIPDPSLDFMTHALSTDALGRLRLLLRHPLRVNNPKPIRHMFRAFTEDLLSFLSAFPPSSLDHSQIEDLALLVTGFIQRSHPASLPDIANSLWDDDNNSPCAKGLESVLHLSTAIYPLSFSPLISLLRVLSVDKRSAAHALNFLEHRMITMCETAEGYADALIALDEDQNVIWDRLRNYSPEFRTTRALTNVKMGGNMVFVQAMREIPGGTYRRALPAGTVGISDENFTIVAWIHSWNGFGAIVYALDTLHDILCSDVPPSPDFRAVLDDLVDSALEALGFVQQLCWNGSDTLRQHICESFGVAETITRIVAEILQMKGKANFSFERLQALLKSASSCLPAIIKKDVKFAARVASILSDAVKRENFAVIISSFGDVASVVLAAFACVTTLLSEDTFQMNFGDTAMDCTRSDEVVGVFQEVITNMLCSGSLSDRSMAVSVESESIAEWLLPLWTMRLFQSKPEILLSSSSAAVLFATTMVSTVSKRPLSESESLLYPAVCEAVVACVNALRRRGKDLSALQYPMPERLGVPRRSKSVNKLTALEEVMLRSDIAEAMAMISCGGAKRLLDDRFYSGWVDSKDRYLLPVRERTMEYQPYNVFLSPSTFDRESTADLWLSGMVTRCLSLQMDCLSQLGTRENIPQQIPWPSSSSTFDANACVGTVVRERIANRISEGHGADLLSLLVAALSCRQRAVSRSLFGSRRSPLQHSDILSCKPNDSEREEQKEEFADPVPAVIFCLKRSFQSYQKFLVGHETAASDEKLEFLKHGGQLSAMIASCVRLLRLGLVSQKSRWFREYVDSDFWEVLTSLVRCGGNIGDSNAFGLKRVTQEWYSCANTSSLSKNSGLDSHRHLVLNAEYVLDIASIWKGIAADVFHITSKEILAEATGVLLKTRSETGESEDTLRLPESLFRSPLFRLFANVFSETWVPVLLATEPLREAIHQRGLSAEMQDVRHLKPPPTLKQLTRQLSARIMETTTGTPSGYDELSQFDRCGDLSVPYGASYAFDVARFRQFLDSRKISDALSDDLILAVMDLNMAIGRQDVYVEVFSSFSTMASIVLFVDSLCPTRNLGLSYSSPQFGGKLCRYLPRVVTSLFSGGALSWHVVGVSLEVSKLLSMLSSRLTKEELEQSALTSMRHEDSLDVPVELSSSTPLGHICHVINSIVSTENTVVWIPEESKSRLQIISWLLLTASRYAGGSAFHATGDLQTLARTCVRTLKLVNGKSVVCAALSTALTETISNMPNDLFFATFTSGVLNVLLSAVDTAANQFEASDQRSRGTAIAGLLLTLTRAVVRLRNGGNTDSLVSLRDVNASGVQPLLPTKEKPVEAYDLEHDDRNVSHTLWCSVLQLAVVAIPRPLDAKNTNMIESDDMRYVVEFCSMHLERIVEDSLDLQKRRGEFWDGSAPHTHLNFHAVTMGKVEEAELGAIVLSRLSPFGLVLQNAMPNTTRHAVEQLCKYTAQATRILRTDPVERWVRPVTQRERERSGVVMEQLTSAVGTLPNGRSTPNRSPSPRRRPRLQVTPKRSPSQALRAALSGMSRLTPSPGASLTPIISPMPNAKQIQGKAPSFSPNSPWANHGSGLITKTGQCFAEEVSMSLIRGLFAALTAIRQFSEHLGIYPFQPTMDAFGDAPGIGTLLAILKLACWELNGEGDEDRRASVQGIADTAMHLTLSHAMTHAETGALPQSVRDEVRKRVTTTLYRANNLVPPIPASSILRDEGLMSLWKRF